MKGVLALFLLFCVFVVAICITYLTMSNGKEYYLDYEFVDSNSSDSQQCGKNKGSSNPFKRKLQYYENKIYRVPLPNEKCTMVIQTYRRAEILPRVIKNYCAIDAVFQKFLIVWNEVETPIPESVTNAAHNCPVPVAFIHPKENIITNRYLIRKEIETDCVCTSDDDKIVFKEDVEFGFDVWRNFRDRHVGFQERTFSLGPQNTYLYGVHNTTEELLNSKGRSSYSILLPAACFMHKAYLEQFFDPMIVPPDALEYVIKNKNCEDILMTAVITKFLQDTGHGPWGAVKVSPKNRVITLDSDSSLTYPGGLSFRSDHYIKRTECLNKFAKMFGYLPLQKTRLLIQMYE